MRTGDTMGLENETVQVRNLRPADLDKVIALDARNTGVRREEYFKLKLEQAITEVGLEISLAAEVDECFAGYLIARVYYGEFGSMERIAMLDSIGVHPDFSKRNDCRKRFSRPRPRLLPVITTKT